MPLVNCNTNAGTCTFFCRRWKETFKIDLSVCLCVRPSVEDMSANFVGA